MRSSDCGWYCVVRVFAVPWSRWPPAITTAFLGQNAHVHVTVPVPGETRATVVTSRFNRDSVAFYKARKVVIYYQNVKVPCFRFRKGIDKCPQQPPARVVQLWHFERCLVLSRWRTVSWHWHTGLDKVYTTHRHRCDDLGLPVKSFTDSSSAVHLTSVW